MANDQTIVNYTAADIEKYHQGLLSPKEMHAMEKAALEDPFLADAMEGYTTAGVSVAADIAELKNRLAAKSEKTKIVPLAGGSKSAMPWLRIAAMIVVLIGGALLAYTFVFTKKENTVAQLEPVTKKEATVADSNKTGTTVTPKEPETAATIEKLNTTAAAETKELSGNTSANTFNYNTTKNKQEEITAAPFPVLRSDEYKRSEQTADKEVVSVDVAKDNAIVQPAPNKTQAIFDDAKSNAEAVASKKAALNRNAKELNKISHVFQGRVIDANNMGVPFANVMNAEENTGTYTDARGYFNLVYPDTVLDVQIRSLGFNQSSVQLKNNIASNQVVMMNDTKNLSAIVINNQKVNSNARLQNNNLFFDEPEPADGWENYDTYIANNVNIPEDFETKQNNTTAVEISFEVDNNGEPVNFKIEKSLCQKCDQEAIRLIKEGPKWKRTAKKGRTTVKIPFNQLFK